MGAIDIRTVTGPDADRALDLAESVWGTRPVDQHLLRALELAGSYVSVAEEDGALVGMCLGIVGVQGRHAHLHSHLAAVDPARRQAGIGRALKRHQREWCLERDIPTVSWTFDPLLHRNARFNLAHLGARVTAYLPELYGVMEDDLNRGDVSDRLLVTWELRSPSAIRALDGALPPPPLDDAEVALADGGGRPDPRPTRARVRLVAVPDDALALRRDDRDLALAWRHAVRDALRAGFAAGLAPVAITDDRCYVLAAQELP